MSEVSAKLTSSGNDERKEDGEKTAAESKTEEDSAETAAPVANDVQRAIDGLKDIPDDEFQEFLNDEAFMKDLDVVDSWEGDKNSVKQDGDDSGAKERDCAKTRGRTRRNRRGPSGRGAPREVVKRDEAKRDDVKRDLGRRDPHKSWKDIERDKLRTRKETEIKMLAEKEKAIKHLLDSDNVVPPGTEVEVIQDINDRQQNSDLGRHSRLKRSRERRRSQERSRASPGRRRSNDRCRLSPHRRRSDERRTIRLTPERRRVGASPIGRRSWDRRLSRERSGERHRRREEREMRLAARRSRSRDRQRSRSSDRYRKRWSRSPMGRRPSPRRRSRTRSRTRSRSRSPDRRVRKRSPFINELARTFRNEALMAPGGPSNFLPGIPPLVGQSYSQNQSAPMNPPFIHHPGPSTMHMQQNAPSFMNFEQRGPTVPLMNFEPVRGISQGLHQQEFNAGPMMYGTANDPRSMQQQTLLGMTGGLSMPMQSPQPVPPPVTSEHPSINYNSTCGNVNVSANSNQQQQQQQQQATMTHNGLHAQRAERLKTPEPPVISNTQQFEKTSLSSLLEASVTAKDTHGGPVLYPGFKPEIMRNCELALRELPSEDLRLRMKGRFFYDPSIEDRHREPEDTTSNSILLMRTGKNTIYWEDERKTQNSGQSRPWVEMHQKICQTDEPERESRGTQANFIPETSDFCVQVSKHDIQQSAKEEKRPIMDRLDWNIRETYDYGPKMHEADDLRWSLSNSSQKKNSWNRASSPSGGARVIDVERELSAGRLSNSDHDSRSLNVAVGSSRNRDDYPFRRSSSRERYSRDRYPGSYGRSIDRTDDFVDNRSDRSRGESPMALEDSTDEVEITREHNFSRGTEWRTRGKSGYRSGPGLTNIRVVRGNPAAGSRSYTARGGFHGQF